MLRRSSTLAWSIILFLGLGAACTAKNNARPAAPSTSATNPAPSQATTLTATSSAPTSAALATSSPTSSATSDSGLRSVDWADITVPGAVCRADRPITLRARKATLTTPAGVAAGTPQVEAVEGPVVYGDLSGNGLTAAAVEVTCNNTSGMADGQLMDTIVVYTGTAASPRAIGTLTPQHPSAPGQHVAYFLRAAIAPHEVVTPQVWYGSNDSTCCPTGRASTAWTWRQNTFTPTTTSR